MRCLLGGLEVHGVEGILQAYSDCLNVVALSGPTLFGIFISLSSLYLYLN